ncbi:MAG TPA: Rieske (2Fe-2S) protein [Candidatus Polarisedimenticolaceae bacterium]|nr:Rieske (2Fe-2S) protein [Candidatus Polarisedimenticolaceae bacterium]
MNPPVWREDFSIRSSEERYLNRRQFAKFLVLTSLGMLVGQLWILIKSWLRRPPGELAAQPVARLAELPVGAVKLFRYPGPGDPCILLRRSEDEYVAFSQKCTHLSCAVYYAAERGRFECPCHEGYFSAQDGRVLQGPPPRPLPRVVLERRGDQLFAVGIDAQAGS